MTSIKFGTDGWRGIIADDFTFENVRIVSQAVADFLQQDHPQLAKKGILIGYDHRFLAEEMAEAAAEVFAGNNIPVLLSDDSLPTPVISYMVPQLEAGGGILITASHNPYQFNGFKFKPHFGGSADDETTRKIESYLYQTPPQIRDFETSRQANQIKITNFSDTYLNHCRSFVDLETIAKYPLKIVVDSMHGTGKDYTARLLAGTPHEVITIAGDRNVYFAGRHPEPIARNLQPLIDRIMETNADFGLATDGDADRIGAVDRHGNFVNPHQIFALLTLHLIKNRQKSGHIVKTISSTQLINKIAEKYQRKVLITPIGFKYICRLMLEEDILIGGEESGGIGFKGHIPERDGLLAGLLLLELMAVEQKPIDQILAEMWSEFGQFHYERIDTYCTNEMKEVTIPQLKQNPPSRLGGVLVRRVDDFDGVKFTLENDNWLLIRPSGTEPVLRLYAEAKTPEDVAQLLNAGKELAGI